MANPMRSLRQQRLLYSIALEVSADITIISAYLLGARQWVLFGAVFLLGKVVGVGVTMYYWNLQDRTIERGIKNGKT
jgi:hypothetical protein